MLLVIPKILGNDGPLANIGYPLWTSGTGRPSGPFLLLYPKDMATKKCPKCSESVQVTAKKCKHCHADLRNWFVRHKILSGILGLFVIVILGSALGSGDDRPTSSTSATTETEEVEAISITARQLYQEYSDNEIAADAKYENQWLEVSGTVQSIGKDILDDMFVSLETGDIIGSVQCMLEDSEFEKAAALNEGQSITMIGKNDGLLLNVILRKCTIE